MTNFSARDSTFHFLNREDAGMQVASRLLHYRNTDSIVLALPRGGVPVGYEVAKRLHVPLNVVVARKIGVPNNPEFGMGAVSEEEVRIFDTQIVRWLGLTEDQIEAAAEDEVTELRRRISEFRKGRDLPSLKDKTVIMVDDGLATGVTAFAAITAVSKHDPFRIVFAVPVCARQTARALATVVDEFVCVHEAEELGSVGVYYRNFEQTSDQEVKQLLKKARDPDNNSHSQLAPS